MLTPTPEFWKVFKETNGALSCAEAVAIMNIAAQAPQGTYIELGTFMGKSAMSASQGLKGGAFVLVEPEFSSDWALPIDVRQQIYPVKDYSVNVLQSMKDMYAYCFVDSGSHQDGLPMQEVKLLEDRMVQGGIIAFHDFRSQFVEVEGAYNYLLSTGKYEEIIIDWNEIIEYVNANNLEEGNLSWHHNELKNPCFVGALKRK